MAWLDPPECIAARECLNKGHLAEAARVLLQSKNQQHRAVRALLLEINKGLVELAEQQYADGHVAAAAQSIELAAQCAALEGRGHVLQQKIAEAIRKHQESEKWREKQAAEAKQLADAGHLHSALDVLAGLGDTESVGKVRIEIQQQLARFDRHIAQCRECLAAGQPEAAYRHWKKAREVAPDDPQLAELSRAIADALSIKATGRTEPRPVTDRSQRLLLGNLAVVVSTDEVCLGTPKSDGVHVPILGPLHGRHAVLLRDRSGWQLAVCRNRHGEPCDVWLNGEPVNSVCYLRNGQRIDLGSHACRWEFRLPVPGSNTAVLEASQNSRVGVTTGSGPLIRRVLLLDKELVISAARPAHIVLSDLPCRQLSLRWTDGGLRYAVEQGTTRMEFPSPAAVAESDQICVPSRLVIEGQLEEAELLGRMAAGCYPAQRLVLEISDACCSPGTSPRLL